jgi:peptidoglycan-N-acetylglucosamine deacetylase
LTFEAIVERNSGETPAASLLVRTAERRPQPDVDRRVGHEDELVPLQLDPEAQIRVLERRHRRIEPANRLEDLASDTHIPGPGEGQEPRPCALKLVPLTILDDRSRPGWVEQAEVERPGNEPVSLDPACHRRDPPWPDQVVSVAEEQQPADPLPGSQVPQPGHVADVFASDHTQLRQQLPVRLCDRRRPVGGAVIHHDHLERRRAGLSGQGTQLLAEEGSGVEARDDDANVQTPAPSAGRIPGWFAALASADQLETLCTARWHHTSLASLTLRPACRSRADEMGARMRPSDRVIAAGKQVKGSNWWRSFPPRRMKDLRPRRFGSDDTVALTFDDGPDPMATPAVLRSLADLGIKATFFMCGVAAQRHPDLVRRAADEGHTIGGHTWHHRDVRTLSDDTWRTEVDRTHELLESLTGTAVRYFRPPGGHYDRRTLQRLRERQLIPVLWSAHGLDWETDDAGLIASRVTEGLQPGAIVLLHDASGDLHLPGATLSERVVLDRTGTVNAIPLITRHLQQSGLRCVALPA